MAGVTKVVPLLFLPRVDVVFVDEFPVISEGNSLSRKVVKDSPAGCGGRGKTSSADDDPDAAAYEVFRISRDGNAVARALKMATRARRCFMPR